MPAHTCTFIHTQHVLNKILKHKVGNNSIGILCLVVFLSVEVFAINFFTEANNIFQFTTVLSYGNAHSYLRCQLADGNLGNRLKLVFCHISVQVPE